MLMIRQIRLLTSCSIRNYAKQSKKMSLNMMQVHHEVMRYVTPYARINITSDIHIKVRPSDIHTYPNGNALIAELHGDANAKNCSATMEVEVSNDEKQVNVRLKKIADKSTFHCEMELPIRAEVFINCNDAVDVSNVDGENVCIKSVKSILTKQIRAENVSLLSMEGNIKCNGLLLGKNTVIEAKMNGNIALDKLQGDQLICKANAGNITVNSCYVEKSKFETVCGNLELNNVHNTSEVIVHNQGDTVMTGVHGNLHLNSNGGKIHLQLSELEGESVITTKGLQTAIINISDKIEHNTDLEIKTNNGISLRDALAHFSESLSDDSKVLVKHQEPSNCIKLKCNIDCKKDLEFGKLSWADVMRSKIGQPVNIVSN